MAFKQLPYLTPDEEDAPNYLSAGTGIDPDVAAAIQSASISPQGTPPATDTPGPSFAPVGPIDPVVEARQKAADELKNRPKQDKPGFWRTLAAAGVGFGGGYVNAEAARYGKRPTVDVNEAVDGILNGGYNRKLSAWQNSVNDLEANANNLEKAQHDKLTNAQTTASTAQSVANTDYLKAETAKLQKVAPDLVETRKQLAKVIGLDEKDPRYLELLVNGKIDKDEHEIKETEHGYVDFNKRDGSTKVITGVAPPKKKEANALTGDARLAAIGAGWDPASGLEPNQAQSAAAMTTLKPPKEARQPSEAATERQAKAQATNQAFQDAGGDWSKVAENIKTGKTYGGHESDIFDHAQKMSQLPPDAQRKVVAADQTAQQVESVIPKIQAFIAAHPHLTGQGPVSSPTRWLETTTGMEPKEIGGIDVDLASLLALQPGQHNFRNMKAMEHFAQATGVDPRTGKYDGQRAWLVNPEKTIEALKELATFNRELSANVTKTAGKGQSTPASASAPQSGSHFYYDKNGNRASQ